MKRSRKSVRGEDAGSGRGLSALAQALAEVCRRAVVDEKWLIAPSLRVGYQWLDAVARSGRAVVNVRVKTLRHAALELAAPRMTREGLSLARGTGIMVLVGSIFGRSVRAGRGYLSGVKPTPGLIRALAATLRDIRLAGLSAGDLGGGGANAFEVESKGREIARILEEYEQALRAGRLVDYADILRMAAARVGNEAGALPGVSLVLLPGDIEGGLKGLERKLWECLPSGKRRVLDVDAPGGGAAGGGASDARLLGWIADHASAPRPARDGTARIFRAVGEVNEVREVLRQCLAGSIPLDDVEILHADTETYVPLIYELASRLKGGEGDGFPVTFAEGLPARYSRPARALRGWLSWIRSDYPQSTLVRMIQDGLVLPGGEEARQAGGAPSFTRLGAVLRTVPIGFGRERYVDLIDRSIEGMRRQIEGAGSRDVESDDEGVPGSRRTASARLEALRVVRAIVIDLLDCAPAGEGDALSLLVGASKLLERNARSAGQFDEYCLHGLRSEIREMAESLEALPAAGAGAFEAMGLDVREWLADLPRVVRIGGQGPRPGCLHVAPLHAGGHSGRGHTFIVGLDDTRFPGAGLQDPLLLDKERGKLSGELATASGLLSRKLGDLAGLLARLRGRVTLSYCCRSLADDRELFPGPALLAAYRILSGEHDGDHDNLLEWVGAPVSFAPAGPESCVDLSEWWLWRLCGSIDAEVEDPEGLVGRSFPHLGRGRTAASMRGSDDFTEYDGWVPEAGADCDPTRPDGPVLSPSRLETLGSCPMDYFFRYVLGIEPLEELEEKPTEWLDARERGQLLHDVFHAFMGRLIAGGLLPEFERDEKLLLGTLEKQIGLWKLQKPPPRSDIFNRQVEELRRTARIFLRQEEEFCRESRPLYLEAAIGIAPAGAGTKIDAAEPVPVRLPDGKIIRVRGIIDRVDEIPGSGMRRFTVWDYKTGSAWGYRKEEPFMGGRRIQNMLYTMLARKRLQEVHPGSLVEGFGYFFPGGREYGERIRWKADELSEGMTVLQDLCRMLAAGCFPYTNDGKDVAYSDYTPAVWDVDAAVRDAGRKLGSSSSQCLAPFRRLRGL